MLFLIHNFIHIKCRLYWILIQWQWLCYKFWHLNYVVRIKMYSKQKWGKDIQFSLNFFYSTFKKQYFAFNRKKKYLIKIIFYCFFFFLIYIGPCQNARPTTKPMSTVYKKNINILLFHFQIWNLDTILLLTCCGQWWMTYCGFK